MARRTMAGEQPLTAAPLTELAESMRRTGWSFRSALVRFAQPEPLRSAAIVELIRRSETAMKPLTASLADGRLAAIGRLAPFPEAAGAAEIEAALATLASVVDGADDLPPEAGAALPVVHAITVLDRLGEAVTAWAVTAPAPAPVAEWDATCRWLRARFDALGVPSESGPPRRGGRS